MPNAALRRERGRRLRPSVLIAAVATLLGCEPLPDCAGACSNAVSVDVRLGERNTEFLAVELDVGEDSMTCPAPQLNQGVTAGCSSDRVSVIPEDLFTCTNSGTPREACQSTGAFAQRIDVAGTPTNFTLRLTASDGTTWSRTFQPNYEDTLGTSPACDTPCRTAREVWVLK